MTMTALTSTAPWIYFAGPLFTQGEAIFNESLANRLRSQGYQIYLPQEACAGITDPQALFATCMRGLEGASAVLVILDGPDADSGSCFEMGVAYAKELPIVGLRTDFRGSGEHMGLNLMLTHSCVHLLISTLEERSSTDRVTYLRPGQDGLAELLTVLRSIPGAERARSGDWG
ncbi:MAG: nucleoside 2-deoxyribosyltransferase [Leptolyngbyaceae cyanobacterium bins.59]|nr:nucleoside 2-deoxyribosyltransferase [Leptolyngbyaceae cyanobacterium bins.59]